MKDPMDMSDGEFSLYQARQQAAARYRSEGFHDFAVRVERGLEDGCSQVRLARFFVEPPAPRCSDFTAAWNESVTAGG